MGFLDKLSDGVRKELKSLAASHPSFRSFEQDMQRLTEQTWHNMLGQGGALVSEAADDAAQDVEAVDPEQTKTAEDNATPNPEQSTSQPVPSDG